MSVRPSLDGRFDTTGPPICSDAVRIIASTIVVAAVALSACSGDDSGAATPEPPTTGAPSTTSAAPTEPTATTTAPTTTMPAPATTAPPEDPTVEISIGLYEGQVEGDQEVSVDLGAPVRIVVAADVSDEVHVHGYDLFADVTPEADAVIEFAADIAGIFEVEMEAQGLELIRLEVS